MKGPKRSKVFKRCKKTKINGNGVAGEAKFVPKQSAENDLEYWSEGEIDTKGGGEEESVVVNREATMYDNLLKKLGSSSELVANAFKRRKREEEGITDTEDESENELEDEDEGSDNESPRRDVRNGLVGSTENSEGSGSDDEEADAFESDGEHDSRMTAESIAKESSTTSSFSSHLEYKLSQGEVDNLLKRKWNYKWEVPAPDLPNCKWTGTGDCFMKDIDDNEMYGVKPRLYQHWLDIYKKSGGSDFQSSKQRFFFSICNSYRDILHHNKKPFYAKGLEEDSCIMDAYVMHSLNHTFRTRDLVTKNDAKLAIAQGKGNVLNGDLFLDHGFTRPKVLILLPLASIAFRVVKRLIQLIPPKHKVNVEHIERFTKEFGSGAGDEEDENDVKNSETKKSSKPSDFQALFGGNNNDHFMIGLKYMGRKIKLFADFYSSDIIVASPLGLISKIGEAEVVKEKDVDYLSSIEVLIIDHADVILMQNWTHVNTVVAQLNRLPVKQHGTDIMRIRPWYLDGQAQFYRQTIILGSHLNPDVNSLFNRHCLNHQGKVKLACVYKGVLPKVLIQVRQIYERFDANSIADVDDARFEYFCEKVFPKVKESVQGGIMLFISSYFEFVRLRNFLKSKEASFCLLGEYSKQSDISRARVWFFHGQRKIMLYTERAHFYHRYKIRAIQNLIIYSLPERKEFYSEIVNMLEGSQNMSCTILFSRFDQFRLERIVGSASAKRMTTSDRGVFVFC